MQNMHQLPLVHTTEIKQTCHEEFQNYPTLDLKKKILYNIYMNKAVSELVNLCLNRNVML